MQAQDSHTTPVGSSEGRGQWRGTLPTDKLRSVREGPSQLWSCLPDFEGEGASLSSQVTEQLRGLGSLGWPQGPHATSLCTCRPYSRPFSLKARASPTTQRRGCLVPVRAPPTRRAGGRGTPGSARQVRPPSGPPTRPAPRGPGPLREPRRRCRSPVTLVSPAVDGGFAS